MNNTRLARTPNMEVELALTAEGNIEHHTDTPTQVSDEEDGVGTQNSGSTDEKDTAILSDYSDVGNLAESSKTAVSNDADYESGKGHDHRDSIDSDGKIVKGEEKNPWSKPFIGIPVNYFSVGIIYGGSVSGKYSNIMTFQHLA